MVLTISIIIFTVASDNITSIVDSLFGTAEIQRDSQIRWDFIKQGQKISNNDLIRTLQNSYVKIRFNDSTLLFAAQNTQFQLNFSAKDSLKNLLNHVTVYSGSVFFVVAQNPIKIYAPPVSLSPFNASFLLSLKPGNALEIKNIQGAFKVQNIKNSASIYLGAPYKTNNSDNQFSRSAVLQEDIDSLKKWIPASTIDHAIEKQLNEARRAFAIISGGMENKCLITLFENKSEYNGKWDIGKNLPLFLAHRVQRSTKRVTSEVLDTVTSNPLNIAILKKARFLLTGEILTFDILQHAEISAQADEYRELRIARVKLQISLIETKRNGLLLRKTITGEIAQKRSKENSFDTVHKLPFDLQNETFTSSILGRAIMQNLDQVVESIVPLLD